MCFLLFSLLLIANSKRSRIRRDTEDNEVPCKEKQCTIFICVWCIYYNGFYERISICRKHFSLLSSIPSVTAHGLTDIVGRASVYNFHGLQLKLFRESMGGPRFHHHRYPPLSCNRSDLVD